MEAQGTEPYGQNTKQRRLASILKPEDCDIKFCRPAPQYLPLLMTTRDLPPDYSRAIEINSTSPSRSRLKTDGTFKDDDRSGTEHCTSAAYR
ncbi:hypothetical protein MRB53_042353 [Persea americana]|nr:hypothetical protein MRB53_042353 [Persea americana]